MTSSPIIKKPGYARFSSPNNAEYVSFEKLFLYPSVRRTLLFRSGQNAILSCGCSVDKRLPVTIKDDLSVDMPPGGHDYACSAYRRKIKGIILSGQLHAFSSPSPAVNVSFRWGKGARNKKHLYLFNGLESALQKGPIDFPGLAGTAASMAYNKRIQRLSGSLQVPGPESIISDLLIELSGCRLYNSGRNPQELDIGRSIFIPWQKEPCRVSFIAGRLLRSEISRGKKNTSLYIETVGRDLSPDAAGPYRISVDTAEWSELLGISDPLSPQRFENMYVMGIVVNKTVSLSGRGTYDSVTHSFYGGEGRSFTIRKAQQLILIEMSKYGLPCKAGSPERGISESYADLGLLCLKPLLPLPGCPTNIVPALLIENDRGPARAFFYKSDGDPGLDPGLFSVSYI